jgi:hypothetical protein
MSLHALLLASSSGSKLTAGVTSLLPSTAKSSVAYHDAGTSAKSFNRGNKEIGQATVAACTVLVERKIMAMCQVPWYELVPEHWRKQGDEVLLPVFNTRLVPNGADKPQYLARGASHTTKEPLDSLLLMG